jgi:hypothetical protein
MSNQAYRHTRNMHQKALESARMNDCRCTATTLCQCCEDRVPEVTGMSHQEFEDTLRSIDAGNSYE